MPSNEKLTEDILALDPNAEVEGLTNPKLVALLKQLRASDRSTAQSKPVGIQLGAPPEDDSPEPTTLEYEPAPQDAEPEKLPEPIPSADTKGPEPTPTAAEPTKVLSVVEGSSITSKRGVLGPGEEVRAEYFVGGEETIQSLKKQGLIK